MLAEILGDVALNLLRLVINFQFLRGLLGLLSGKRRLELLKLMLLGRTCKLQLSHLLASLELVAIGRRELEG